MPPEKTMTTLPPLWSAAQENERQRRRLFRAPLERAESVLLMQPEEPRAAVKLAAVPLYGVLCYSLANRYSRSRLLI